MAQTTTQQPPPDESDDEFVPPFVAIVFFSKRGRLVTLANAIAAGIRSVGAEAQLFRVPPLATDESPDRFAEEYLALPPITAAVLKRSDAILVGSPGRQGRICAEVAHFLDSWAPFQETGVLMGKIGGGFTSAGGVGRGYGGHESLLSNLHSCFLQQGMLVVGVPPSADMDDCPLASPYGACMAGASGSGARELSEAELRVAQNQGRHVATVAMRLKAAEDVVD